MVEITSKYSKVTETYAALRRHINSIWPENSKEEYSLSGTSTLKTLVPDWCVIEIAPLTVEEPWVYISLGTWEITKDEVHEPGRYGIDFLIISPEKSMDHIKTLAMVAIYHADPKLRINIGHIIDVGDPGGLPVLS
jgi:hypothetical protein